MTRTSDIRPASQTSSYSIPLNALIAVPVREANADFAVSQAMGKLEFLFEMLQELVYLDNPKLSHLATWDRDEVIAKISGHWEDMDLISLQEHTEAC
jgi:hypothetical protein